MSSRKNSSAARFAQALEQHAADTGATAELALDSRPGTTSLGAWFLGPKAENLDLLCGLIARGIQENGADRRGYFPSDPAWITEEIKQSPDYRDSVSDLERHYGHLLKRLEGSVPLFSYRYQAHMLWDTTLPGMLGYFAGMLYNQNNVAAEASPVTTLLEIQVGYDLCRMLGYAVPPHSDTDAIAPWGHITCDGSVANIESMWASRNLKYYPVALAQALQAEAALAPAKHIAITLPDGRSAELVQLDTWTLLNLTADAVLAIPARMQKEFSIDPDTLSAAMTNYTLQNLGFQKFSKYLADVPQEAVVVTPATMHYSWPKAAALLGIGSSNILTVPVDLDARMDMNALRAALDQCLAARRPVIMAVAVVGSTEESAVDPLADIVALRAEYRLKGLEFTIHADAAWGGYFASILRADPHDADPNKDSPDSRKRQYTPDMVMSAYVNRQYLALKDADSVTVDPHKGGYIPYPAGGLCYRNSAMRGLVSFTAPVVYHGGIDPTVGVYGVEGSKPGAAAAGVYLSHRVIRSDRSGYGKILGKCLFNSKRLYASLVTMAEEDDPFVLVPFQRLPAEREGKSEAEIKAQLAYIRERIVPPPNDALIADQEAMALLRELGSDQVILAYAFNFKTAQGLNRDVARLNQLNNALYADLSLGPDRDKVREQALIVTSSSFDPAVYGSAFVEDFKRRLGVAGDPDTPITFLVSTTMDPWVTDTAQGNFIPALTAVLRQAVCKAIQSVS